MKDCQHPLRTIINGRVHCQSCLWNKEVEIKVFPKLETDEDFYEDEDLYSESIEDLQRANGWFPNLIKN